MISKSVFINLATKNVAAAREFYSKLGFEINKMYSSEQNVFVVIAENVQLILAEESLLRQLGEYRELADATKVMETYVALSASSREEVDELLDMAIAAGGKQFGEAMEEKEIGLYARAFSDLDGHKIDIMYMPVSE
jgi:predicted lactoylglutathione lyase